MNNHFFIRRMYTLFLIPVILKISIIKVGVFGPPPPEGRVLGLICRIPKWEKWEYCNTIKIILYNFVNIL